MLRAPGYAQAVPLPAVAIDDPAYSDRETWWGRHRHWRGPSWVNSAWFVTLGLRRLGLGDEAAAMAQRLAAVMEREGFREYYESRSGRGMGAHDFGWSTLIVELLDPTGGGRVTIAVGIAGCGKVARHHVPALRAARGVELVAAFDVDRAPRGRPARAVAGSLAELIERVDLVAVCTPPETHAEVAVEALEAGRDVLVEKPLATTLDDADRIVAAAERPAGRDGLPAALPPQAAGGARRRSQASGAGRPSATVGPLLDRAVHHVDLWRALLGDEVADARVTRHNGGVRLEAVMRGGAGRSSICPADGPPRNVLVVDGRRDRSLRDGRRGSTGCATRASWAAAARTRRVRGAVGGDCARAPPATVADGRRALEIVLGA